MCARGRWGLASSANVRAIDADARYRAIVPQQDFYRVYMAHNHHFLSFAAMMAGRKEVARKAADDMIAGVPPEFVKKNAALVDPVAGIKIDVLKRFGDWDELRASRPRRRRCRLPRAMWRFARRHRAGRQRRIDEARREQVEFRAAVAKVPPERNVDGQSCPRRAGHRRSRCSRARSTIARATSTERSDKLREAVNALRTRCVTWSLLSGSSPFGTPLARCSSAPADRRTPSRSSAMT
jgi:hypothetical protein